MKSLLISQIRKKFSKEWMLISVDKTDPVQGVSVSGRLIAHSHNRDEIYKRLMLIKSKKPLLVEYSEDNLPQGMVALF